MIKGRRMYRIQFCQRKHEQSFNSQSGLRTKPSGILLIHATLQTKRLFSTLHYLYGAIRRTPSITNPACISVRPPRQSAASPCLLAETPTPVTAARVQDNQRPNNITTLEYLRHSGPRISPRSVGTTDVVKGICYNVFQVEGSCS